MKRYLIEQPDYVRGYLYYSRDNNEPISYIWYMKKGGNEYQYRVRNVDAFGFDFAVRKEYRGNGIVGYMINEVLQKLQEHGVTELYASVRKNNEAALRAYRKLNMQIVRSSHFAKIGPFRIPYPIV